MRPSPRTVVVDKNFLERPELEEFLKDDPGNRILLHDFSAIEALAGNALRNTTLAMAIACEHPRQVMVLKNSSKLLAMGAILPEFRFEMVDWPQTRGFPNYCADLQKAAAGDSERIAAIAEHARAAAEHLNRMLANVPLLAGLVERLARETSRDVVLARRDQKGHIPPEGGLRILQEIYEIARAMGAQSGNIPALPRSPAEARHYYVFRFAMALRLFALWWADQGSEIQSANHARLRNDFVDLMYVTCATYWDDLFTNEKKVAKIYGESRYLLEAIYPHVHDPVQFQA